VKALVLGANGQLACHLKEELPGATFWGRSILDLGKSSEIAAAINRFRPTIIVNAAAYTAVDKAETERSLAWSLNATAPAAIAEVASALGAPLVHISTDYVFDGSASGEYASSDPVRPISIYGYTKLAGELAVKTLCEKSWILRTSWVFSEHGQNFVRTILRLAASRDSLRVVADQFGRPTYAGDIAVSVAKIVARSNGPQSVDFGLYHATGGPIVSWFQFATEVVRIAHDLGILKTRTAISPITTAEYPTAARRPANSALSPSPKVATEIGATFDWPSRLEQMLKKIANVPQALGVGSP
jgi:dTDP-4-dehydrorhamnose reductase